MSDEQPRTLYLFNPDDVSPENVRYAVKNIVGEEAMQKSGINLPYKQRLVILDWLIYYSGKPELLVREAFKMPNISISEIFLPEDDLQYLIASKRGDLR